MKPDGSTAPASMQPCKGCGVPVRENDPFAVEDRADGRRMCSECGERTIRLGGRVRVHQ